MDVILFVLSYSIEKTFTKATEYVTLGAYNQNSDGQYPSYYLSTVHINKGGNITVATKYSASVSIFRIA